MSSSSTHSKKDRPPILMPPGFVVQYAAPDEDRLLQGAMTRRDLTGVLIIVDISRLRNESWENLGDLLSGIAFVAPHQREGYDRQTLLRFIRGNTVQGPTRGISAHDKAVMATLYALPNDYDLSDGLSWMASHFPTEARSQ